MEPVQCKMATPQLTLRVSVLSFPTSLSFLSLYFSNFLYNFFVPRLQPYLSLSVVLLKNGDDQMQNLNFLNYKPGMPSFLLNYKRYNKAMAGVSAWPCVKLMKTLAIYSSEVFLLSVVQSDLVVMFTSMPGFYVFENEVRAGKRKATFTYTNKKKTHKPC